MSQLPFSKYDAEFRKDHPETIGETDKTFDLSNYCEWLEKRVADRDALRAELERTKEELENMAHAVRFLAKQEARTFEIRGMAIQMLAKGRVEEAKDLVMLKWPIVQGLRNQIDLATVGNQGCDYKRVRPAIELLLRAALELKGGA